MTKLHSKFQAAYNFNTFLNNLYFFTNFWESYYFYLIYKTPSTPKSKSNFYFPSLHHFHHFFTPFLHTSILEKKSTIPKPLRNSPKSTKKNGFFHLHIHKNSALNSQKPKSFRRKTT